MAHRARLRGESGAVLVHVGLALLVLIAFSALAVDYGIMWASRTQAQAAADAGALAGAVSLAYSAPPADRDDLGDPAYTAARDIASAVARQNPVWGQAPRVTNVFQQDVQFIDCPAGGVPDRCVRVNAYRNQEGGDGNVPLPTFFARLVGVENQGVRATATASILSGSMVPRCMKPFALPDRWLEGGTTPSEFGDQFEDPPDVYDASRARWRWPDDYGTPIVVHTDAKARLTSSWAQLIAVGGSGGAAVGDAIRGCVPNSLRLNPNPAEELLDKPGGTEGPVKHAIADLRASFPGTQWDHGARQLVCGDPGGCDNFRLGAIPVFDPREAPSGRGRVPIMDIIGVYLEGMGDDADVEGAHPELVAKVPKRSERAKFVVAHIVPYAALRDGSAGPPRPSSFARTVVLVR